MKRILLAAASLVVAGSALYSPNAEAGLRRFYWTAESQSYGYDRGSSREDCFQRAESEAYPYAYNTCVQRIGSLACESSTSYTERLGFGGEPGLYNCKVRVWVEAWE